VQQCRNADGGRRPLSRQLTLGHAVEFGIERLEQGIASGPIAAFCRREERRDAAIHVVQ
jgi:hypothetical protein